MFPSLNRQFLYEYISEEWDFNRANWGDIWAIHERVAKYLADSLLQLYIDDFYGLDQNVVAEVFRYARMEEPQREKKQRQAEQRLQALNELSNIE